MPILDRPAWREISELYLDAGAAAAASKEAAGLASITFRHGEQFDLEDSPLARFLL